MSLVSDSSSFGVTSTSNGPSTVLAIRGKVEGHAAFELAAHLESAIDRHPELLILDLSKLDSIGVAGMVAISNAEKRLADLGMKMTVRSPSVAVNRILDAMETAQESRIEGALAGHVHRGPEDPRGSAVTSSGFRSHVPSADLRRLTAIPTDPDVVDGALGLVVELALSRVSGADGVSVSLLRNGVLSTVAASDQTIMAMDADQYATGEGPCVDASVKGHWFHAESLDDEIRWPSFTPRARELGIKAILSSPLTAFAQPIGALNIYSRTAETFEVKDQETAAIFAQKASVILSDARAGVSDTRMASRFKEALRSREAIAMAKGVTMERYGFDEQSAFAALLRLSLYHGEPLRDRAELMVRSAYQPELGSTSASHG